MSSEGNKSFMKDMLKVYASATLGDMFTASVIHGIRGDDSPLYFDDALLHGFQTATTFVAYPIATKILSNVSETFRHHYEDEDGCKVAAYVAGGIGAAGVVALINYPLSKIRRAHQKEEPTIQFSALFVDSIGPNIGAALATEMIDPMLPSFGNPLFSWARNQMLNAAINLSATIGSVPTSVMAGGRIGDLFNGYIADMFPSAILADSFGHISAIL